MFEITHKDGTARVGILETEHGKVETPFFMPVASRGTVKSLDSKEITDLNFQSIISNSFILSLYPGIDVVEKLGGIHKFMNFKKTIFTDSGGFQVLSKDFLLKKSDEGVLFKDKTGKKSFYTPELAIQNQFKLNSDVAMTFDDVAHYGLNGKDYVDAIKRTHLWAKRCLTEHSKLKKEYGSNQLLFGISQGGTKAEYRRFSTTKINRMEFDGYALGGLVVGEKRAELFDTIKEAVKCFDEHKIKYLMGLGSPPDIVWAVGLGVDCFDSIYPTSNARHGSLITKKGRIDILKKKYKEDENPIDEKCKCEVCKNYSRAYVHHLFKNHELTAFKLATIHNLYFMNKLVEDLRKAIKKGNYSEFAEDFLKEYFSGTEKKEFSSNIQQKYLEKEIKEGARFLLDWKR
ncbi:MAG: tRNA guanosine(34) transglycosylase Tgt [Candidatus Woesearchaeota archaeon]